MKELPPFESLYINPFTNFAFQRFFGERQNQELLLSFLNAVLPIRSPVEDLDFIYPRISGVPHHAQDVVDIYCRDANGQRFIVELLKAEVNLYHDRKNFTSYFPIIKKAEKWEWDFKSQFVYCVALVNFAFAEHANVPGYIHNVDPGEDLSDIFYDRLRLVYVEVPKFNKPHEELLTVRDKWLHFLRFAGDFIQAPEVLGEPVFSKLFQVARIASLDEKERVAYQYSLKEYMDATSVLNKRLEEAEKEATLSIARKMRQQGLSDQIILAVTGVDPDTLGKLEGREESGK